jgi:broad specificity phosphatase PhoE
LESQWRDRAGIAPASSSTSKTALTLCFPMMSVKGSGPKARMDMPARITFIAHAATEAQRNAAFPLDEPILEREHARIAKASRILAAAEHVWSAPERRAQETSRLLDLPARVADELRDCDYGRWRGKTLGNLQNEEPDGVLMWLTDTNAIPHGGESIQALIGRIGKWMDERSHEKHTVAVTHPAVIRAAVVCAMRLPPQSFWRIEIAPATLTDLRFSRDQWTLRCVGCSMPTIRRGEEDDEADV